MGFVGCKASLSTSIKSGYHKEGKRDPIWKTIKSEIQIQILSGKTCWSGIAQTQDMPLMMGGLHTKSWYWYCNRLQSFVGIGWSRTFAEMCNLNHLLLWQFTPIHSNSLRFTQFTPIYPSHSDLFSSFQFIQFTPLFNSLRFIQFIQFIPIFSMHSGKQVTPSDSIHSNSLQFRQCLKDEYLEIFEHLWALLHCFQTKKTPMKTCQVWILNGQDLRPTKCQSFTNSILHHSTSSYIILPCSCHIPTQDSDLI